MKFRYKALIYLVSCLVIFTIVCGCFGFTPEEREFNVIKGFANLLETKLIIIILPITFIVPGLFILIFWTSSLNAISGENVGNGQHGDAKFMDEEEKKRKYKRINIWDKVPGWIIGYEKGKFLLEPDDNNIFVLAPPGGGKTRRLVLLNIIHSMFVSGFFLVTDIKGKTIKLVAPIAKAMGYRLLYFDARNPMRSHKFNFLSTINKYNDRALLAEDKIERAKYRAKAQKYAKILAKQIVGVVLKSPSGAGQNQFFYDTAEGIMASLILLVSQYADQEERHILSVFKIIQEQAQQDENSDSNKTKLFHLLQKLPEDDKSKWMAAPGAQAEIRVALNSFSTALTSLLAFIDDEMEQMICFESDFDVEDLLKDNKVGIVFNIPEENRTRHFMLSLFINTLTQQLIELADDQPTGVLPFDVKEILDEVGTAPAIDNIEETMTGSRERGILLMPILQSLPQLVHKYGQNRADIIINACKTFIFSGLGTMQKKDAQAISDVMGKKTIRTGSITRNAKTSLIDNSSVSESMMGKALMSVRDIMQLEQGQYVVLKTGANPLKTYLGDYTEYKYGFDIEPLEEAFIEETFEDVKYFNSAEFEKRLDVLQHNIDLNLDVATEDILMGIDDGETEEIRTPAVSVDCWEEIKQYFTAKNSMQGIEALANSNIKDIIKLLYKFHKSDELAFDTFQRYKNFLKENM